MALQCGITVEPISVIFGTLSDFSDGTVDKMDCTKKKISELTLFKHVFSTLNAKEKTVYSTNKPKKIPFESVLKRTYGKVPY